ncbi:heavy metal translocating P-type ATPase [Lacticaseibacillus saniviri JCM 17471 = DSM 24301]|uniref:Cd(2+)-exporting ATPase n=1 Tax=Lacticaseibacillus saniviri JCM 17471 = DSM 24301 TaxID=1293598 RepID=A0A0R2MZB6_9LACO|nr:heavy metal translocating P-type ATPase [Lacticaseibacillus saniviri JCM 17471 = DSM 24301]
MEAITLEQSIKPKRRMNLKSSWLDAEMKRRAAILGLGMLLLVLGAFVQLGSISTIILYLSAYLLTGYPVIAKAVRNLFAGDFFDENALMTVATIGAIALGEYPEAVAVMLFYQIGDMFEDIAVARSKDSITALLALKPTTVTVSNGADIKTMAPEQVAVGSLILVRPGEKVPLDGEIVAGSSAVNMAALTGESLPESKTVGDVVLSGGINEHGLLTIRTTKRYQDSTVAKILTLVETASAQKAPTERLITRFARRYTPIVVALAGLLAIVPPLLFAGSWQEWISRALIFLVISCPCALVISVPLSYFSGIGAASRRGILIKGGQYLETLNALEAVVFDKTGTLTAGQFEVTAIQTGDGFTRDQVLTTAAAVEQQSSHPLAQAIVRAAGDQPLPTVSTQSEVPGQGIIAEINRQSIVVGNRRALGSIAVPPLQETTDTVIYVAIDGQFAGVVTLADRIKPDAKATIHSLKQHRIQSVMLTGDNQHTAASVADQLGIDRVAANLLPEDKLAHVSELEEHAQHSQRRVAFVGDGINDTPVLKRADVGIAMGGLGADAAVEAADIVIMQDEPSQVITAIQIAKQTHRIVWQNIIFALGVKVLFLALAALGLTTMWVAVFADVGVTLLAVLNAIRGLHQVER